MLSDFRAWHDSVGWKKGDDAGSCCFQIIGDLGSELMFGILCYCSWTVSGELSFLSLENSHFVQTVCAVLVCCFALFFSVGALQLGTDAVYASSAQGVEKALRASNCLILSCKKSSCLVLDRFTGLSFFLRHVLCSVCVCFVIHLPLSMPGQYA